MAEISDRSGEFKSFNSLGEFIKRYQAGGLMVLLLDAGRTPIREILKVGLYASFY